MLKAPRAYACSFLSLSMLFKKNWCYIMHWVKQGIHLETHILTHIYTYIHTHIYTYTHHINHIPSILHYTYMHMFLSNWLNLIFLVLVQIHYCSNNMLKCGFLLEFRLYQRLKCRHLHYRVGLSFFGMTWFKSRLRNDNNYGRFKFFLKWNHAH